MWKIFQEKLRIYSLGMNGNLDPVGSVMFVEIISEVYETHEKTLKLISPIQDHFLMSWLNKICGFKFRGLKRTWN